MTNLRQSERPWTRVRCAAAARNFSDIASFKRYAPNAYKAAEQKGWLTKLISNPSS